MSLTLNHLLRGGAKGLDLAENAKVDDLASKVDDLARIQEVASKVDDLARLGDLRLGDLVKLDDLLGAAEALKSADVYVDQIVDVMLTVPGPAGEKLQRSVQKLQTALALAHQGLQSAGRPAAGGTGKTSGRDVHIHLHLGA